jgi:hypothetical protein
MALQPIINLTASTNLETSIELAWTGPVDEPTRYIVRFSKDNGPLSTQQTSDLGRIMVPILGPREARWTITGLAPDSTYGFELTYVSDDTFPGELGEANPAIGSTTSGRPIDDPIDPIDDPIDPLDPTLIDALGSFIFMTKYIVPVDPAESVTVEYQRGKMSTGLIDGIITRSIPKQTLIDNFGLDPDFSGTREFNKTEYNL